MEPFEISNGYAVQQLKLNASAVMDLKTSRPYEWIAVRIGEP
ncbi:hypothetical protein [Timonella sp. A28]